MGHPMFEYDATLADEVFDYCRDRLSMDPVPLDFGSLNATAPGDMKGFIRPEVTTPTRFSSSSRTIWPGGRLDRLTRLPRLYSERAHQELVAVRHGRRLLGPQRHQLVGVERRRTGENLALEYLAELAGMPRAPAARLSPGDRWATCRASPWDATSDAPNIRTCCRTKCATRSPRTPFEHRKALHVLGVQPLIVTTDDHRFTRASSSRRWRMTRTPRT